MILIQTRYLKRTAKQPPRIVATELRSGVKLTRPYLFRGADDHLAVAFELAAKEPWGRQTEDYIEAADVANGGYVVAFKR